MKSKELNILNSNFQFQNVYRNGKSFVSPIVITYVVPRRREGIRLGITASKKVGCAARRNRARRVIRAAVDEIYPMMSGSFDLVFVARGSTVTSKSHLVRDVLLTHLKSAGVIGNKDSAIYPITGDR